MTATYIDTNECTRIKLPGGQGTVAEIVNGALCGAQNAIGLLRCLGDGERFQADVLQDRHQLIYLMEGNAMITLEAKSYPVSKGAGIYLGPSETATIAQTGAASLKLLHLVVGKE